MKKSAPTIGTLTAIFLATTFACSPRKANEAKPPTDEATAPDSADVAVNSPWEKAKARGVTFRASGEEPGWFLEVTDAPAAKHLYLLYDYGESTLAFDAFTVAASDSDPRTVYAAESGGRGIEVRVSTGPCYNGMSGEESESKVEVRLGERLLYGCGRSLR